MRRQEEHDAVSVFSFLFLFLPFHFGGHSPGSRKAFGGGEKEKGE